MSEAPVSGRALSILLHGDTKVGKSTMANTAPAPRCLIDVEAAYRFLPGSKVFWNPMVEAPPAYDGTWETCVVKTLDYSTFNAAFTWIKSGQHPFRSLIVDSVSELQVKCKEQIQGGDFSMTQQRWGELLGHMSRVIREMRDLTEHPIRPLEAVVLTAMTELRDGKWRPRVEGALRVTMPYFLDVIGYLYVQEVAGSDPTVPTTKQRTLLVTPHPQFEAGERVQGRLGERVTNPRIDTMIETVFGGHE